MPSGKRLAFWILAAVLLGAAAKAVHLRSSTRALLARSLPKTLGMGDTLKSTVDTLEQELRDRIAYETPAGRDPLALKRVVKAALPRAGGENIEAGRMRLSATLVSPPNSSAIIKFKGHSYTLRLGDTLEQRVVRSIDKKTVTFDFKGVEVILVNEPAPKAEIQSEGGKRRLEELQL